jgi:hypothetical protein
MKNKTILLIIIVFILTLGIGYASIETSLNMNGTVNIEGNTFNQTFNNIALSPNNTVTSTPTINNKTVTSTVTLTNPNDLYDFYIYANNNGTLDAMITNITINGPDNPNIEYSVTYADGQAIEQYDRLAINASKPILVHAKYIGTTSVATEIIISFTINYTKATAAAVEKTINFTMPTGFTGTKYTVNMSPDVVTLNSAISNTITQYNTAEAAVDALNKHTCFKHTIEDNIVTGSQIVLLVTDEMAASITGATAGTYTFSHNQYDQNVSTLQSALGSNCSKSGNTYNCTADGISITVSKKNGNITINNCTLSSDSSSCS